MKDNCQGCPATPRNPEKEPCCRCDAEQPVKYILYGCADCLDDSENVITFAVQGWVNASISCPICRGISCVAEIGELYVN